MLSITSLGHNKTSWKTYPRDSNGTHKNIRNEYNMLENFMEWNNLAKIGADMSAKDLWFT
jgi:hypothetical protein